MPLHLYTIFHLNLAFSSIEVAQRPEVIRRCYWPLLHLARDLDIAFGIEISGYSLETAAAIDSKWVRELSDLCAGKCELVGSGYAQLIGPLVPAEVNRQNLRLGNETYQRILGRRPDIALVNEQAYSAGLVRHYLDAGFKAIVMEWDNPARHHRQWHPDWRYYPQIALGQRGEEIPVIWNNSISFQKFQRYVHDELELHEYLASLSQHDNGAIRAFPLYGNDVEIFDFRPGRFTSETALVNDEWRRIRALMEQLRKDPRFLLTTPSKMLPLLKEKGAGNRLRLESAQAPIPVKKQEKYNITRWAVTGRDDLGVNTKCQRIHDALISSPHTVEKDWKELCYLWSSDFRTHITQRRWQSYKKRLGAFVQRMHADIPDERFSQNPAGSFPAGVSVTRDARYLTIESAKVKMVLNLRRGLAINSLIFSEVCGDSLCGTLPHGYYDDIGSGADFYTGHFVFESLGHPKVTDLVPVAPTVGWDDATKEVTVAAMVETCFGNVFKQLSIQVPEAIVTLQYSFVWDKISIGSLRVGNLTLNPDAFSQDELYYRTHNGGHDPETFSVAGTRVAHGKPTSFLVSTKQGFGATEGIVQMGDSKKALQIEIDRSRSTLLGLITFNPVISKYFFRCSFSAREMDETSKKRHNSQFMSCKLRITGIAGAH